MQTYLLEHLRRDRELCHGTTELVLRVCMPDGILSEGMITNIAVSGGHDSGA